MSHVNIFIDITYSTKHISFILSSKEKKTLSQSELFLLWTISLFSPKKKMHAVLLEKKIYPPPQKKKTLLPLQAKYWE